MFQFGCFVEQKLSEIRIYSCFVLEAFSISKPLLLGLLVSIVYKIVIVLVYILKRRSHHFQAVSFSKGEVLGASAA
jgi:hypothetical protein